MTFVTKVESKVAAGLGKGYRVDLNEELDAEPPHFEIIKFDLNTMVGHKEHDADNLVDALVFHSQVIENLVMTGGS